MAPPADRLFSLAAAVLAAVETAFAAEGVDLPERRYVSPGAPAWDCDEGQATVHVTRAFSLGAGAVTVEAPEAGALTGRRGVEVAVEVVRCVPTLAADGSPPSAASLDAAAERMLGDAQIAANGVLAAYRSGDLPGCGGVAVGAWTAVGPEGSLAGGTLSVRLDTSGLS